MTQEKLAQEARVHRTYVSQLERGLKSPSLRTAYKLSTALQVNLSQLMELVEDEIEQQAPN